MIFLLKTVIVHSYILVYQRVSIQIYQTVSREKKIHVIIIYTHIVHIYIYIYMIIHVYKYMCDLPEVPSISEAPKLCSLMVWNMSGSSVLKVTWEK